MLVEAATQQVESAIVTVDDGSEETKFIIPQDRVKSVVQTIDDAGESQEETFRNIDTAFASKTILINNWLSTSFKDSEQLKQAQRIFDDEFLRDPSCVNLFGSIPRPRSGYEYSFDSKDPLILKLAQFVPPPPGGRIKETTGPGEFAIGYLLGLVPAREVGYDFRSEDGADYTVKHQSSAGDLGIFTYKFRSAWKSDLAANYEKDPNKIEGSEQEVTRIKNALTKAKANLQLTKKSDANKPLTYSQAAAALLDLTRPVARKGFVSADGRTRWALVCNLGKAEKVPSTFTFKAFSISARLLELHNQELQIARGNIISRSNKIRMSKSEVSIMLSESKKNHALISELSRRDQEQVTAIARRIAQEVLEDELGDDFDKAVRREMVASFKDGEVEDGIADISKEYMRKFYRSLGVGTSPLDKVKI
jgi:hypothetical protein